MTRTLDLRLLGPWQAELDGMSLPALPTRHARALLARLALAHPCPVLRDRLHADLFGDTTPGGAWDEPPGNTFQHLRTTLYYLRRILPVALQISAEDVALDPSLHVQHDVGQFEAAAQGITRASMETAMRLYRGPFLSNTAGRWAAGEAQRLQALYIDVLRRAVALAQAEGRPEAAREAALRWTRAEPWEERAHVALIAALREAGDRAAARAQIAQARVLLRTRSGNPPGSAFEALARDVARMPATPVVLASPLLIAPNEIQTLEELPFVDRDEVMNHLFELWNEACRGVPQALVIEAAAGVGKTRLVQEFTAQLRRDAQATILHGAADEHTADQRLGLLRAALRTLPVMILPRLLSTCQALDQPAWSVLVEELPELQRWDPDRSPTPLARLDHASEAARLQAAVTQLVDALAASGPLLLVLDNVQRADDETLALVRSLLTAPRRLLVLMLSRPAGRYRDDMPVLHLGPLSEAATRELLHVTLGGTLETALEATFVTQSSGNPLFMHEILSVLVAQGTLIWNRERGWHLARPDLPLPDSVSNLLAERLADLPPDALGLAGLLAVLGRPASGTLLAQLWPNEEERLEAQALLLERSVAQERDSFLYQDHDWLRETLLAMLDDETRASLHRRIVRALEADPAADAAERMRHYAGAHEWAQALAAAIIAGQQALHEGRTGVVARALDLAERCSATLKLAASDPRRWPLLLLRESHQAMAERGPAWLATLDAMDGLSAANGRVDWQIEALTRKGRAQREQGQPDAAETTLRRAALLAAEAALPVAEAIARYNLAAVLDDRGAVDEALSQSSAAVRASLHGDDDELHVRTQATLAYMQMRSGQVAEAEALLAALLGSASIERHPGLRARLVRQLGIVRMAARNYEAGLALLRESVQHAEVTQDLQGMLICQTSLCYELTNFGLYEESQPLAEATSGLARRLGARTQEAALLNLLARSLFESGDVAAARQPAVESAAIAEALRLPEYAAESLNMIATLALAEGHVEEAVVAITHADRLLADHGHPTLTVAHTAARVWLAAGQRTRAAERARVALREVVDQGLPSAAAIGVLWEAAGVIAAVEGPVAAEPVKQRAYDRLVDDMSRLVVPRIRRAFISATAAHRAVAAWRGKGVRRLVVLPLADAPTGRPLYPDEQVPVVWTLHDPDDPEPAASRRRRQIRRLANEAVAQGARATVEAIAGTLHVSTRTVLRDLQALKALGDELPTRGSAQK